MPKHSNRESARAGSTPHPPWPATPHPPAPASTTSPPRRQEHRRHESPPKADAGPEYRRQLWPTPAGRRHHTPPPTPRHRPRAVRSPGPQRLRHRDHAGSPTPDGARRDWPPDDGPTPTPPSRSHRGSPPRPPPTHP